MVLPGFLLLIDYRKIVYEKDLGMRLGRDTVESGGE